MFFIDIVSLGGKEDKVYNRIFLIKDVRDLANSFDSYIDCFISSFGVVIVSS